MTKPIFSYDVRPTMMVRKRNGIFSTGSRDYRPKGSFRITLDENKTSITEAFVDNIPHINEDRILDNLHVSDRLLIVIDGTDGVETALFNGTITQILFDRANALLRITAQDAAFVGASTMVNDILHQKFIDSFETTLDNVGDEYTTTLPADTDLAAPITVQNRVAYGNPLRPEHNHPNSLDFDVVYSSPIINYSLRGTLDPTLESSNGAKKYAAQTFLVNRNTQITNIFFPIAQYIRLYPGEVAPGGGIWNQIGIGDLQNIIQVPLVADATFGMPHTRMGPNNKLRVSLVKCTKTSSAAEAVNRKTLTKSGRDVETRVNVPTYGAPGDEQLNYADGSFYANADFGITTEYDSAIRLASIEISPTEPIQSPHQPAGEIPKMTHKWSQLHDDSNVKQEAYTMFGWSLEDNPVSVEAGEYIALIFEMLGNTAHPQLTDGVEPANKSNPDSYLSPMNMWALGISRKLDTTVANNVHENGAYLVAALTNGIGSNRTLVGTHGMAAYRPLQDADNLLPNYNGVADVGVWEYNDKLNDNSLQNTWNANFESMIDNLNENLDELVDGDANIVSPGGLPDPTALFAGLYDLSSMYFTVITGSWIRLGRGLYWDVDDSGKVNFGKGSVSWTPFSTNRFGLSMARVAVYTNPATGGLLDANNKSSVSDVVNAIIGKIPDWQNIIVDEMLDGINDVEGDGFNNPVTYPLSYWQMKEESAWSSLQRLATEYDAVAKVHTDINDISTVIFEKRKNIIDFNYDSPGDREYTISSRNEDENWMKHLMDSRIERDIDTMYSRFRIIGNQNVEIGDVNMQLGLPLGQPSPIVFELDIPENEEKLGFVRQKEFKAETTITTHEQALIAAQAMKTLYGNDTFSGTLELSGLWPVYEHATLGAMFDTNCILRLIDKDSVSGDSATGTDNIFRVTGIHYSSSEHKTDLILSTSVINRSVSEAQHTLDTLKKKTESSSAIHMSRLAEPIYGNRLLIDKDVLSGSIKIYLNYAQAQGNPTGSQVNSKLLLELGETMIAGAKGHLISVFEPGIDTIENDLLPWVAGEIHYLLSTNPTGNPIIVDFNIDATYKYSSDTLTVIVPVELE